MAFSTTIIQGKSHSAADLYAPQNDLLNGSSGVVGTSDFVVTQNSPLAMSVLVTGGTIYSYISSASTYYRHKLSDATTALSIDANSSGSTRIDLICVKTDLTVTPDVNGVGSVSLVVVKGTPGAGVPATPANHDKLAEVSVANGAANITNANITDRRTFVTLRTSLLGSDGWVTSSDTWVYASASTFTIAGVDRTTTFTKGTRLKFTQTTAKYAVVVASSFSTNTTVTIAVNNDYTIANAAITSPYYSYQASPQGYPTWFNYDSTWTGFSAVPTDEILYSITGRAITVLFAGNNTGTSNSATFEFTVPVASSSINGDTLDLPVIVLDNGAFQNDLGVVGLPDTATTAKVGKAIVSIAGGAYAGFTASGGKGISGSITYRF